MFLTDLLLAARSLRNNLSFSFTAIAMIAIGTGAVTLMFAVLNAVLLRPLPYKNPDRLVVAYGDLHARSNYGVAFSYENFVDIGKDLDRYFEDFAAMRTGRMTLTWADGTNEQVRYGEATTSLFRTLGARLALGRDFEAADAQPQTGNDSPEGITASPNMVILSHDFWRRHYGADRGVLGKSIDGGPGRSDRIVGVLAPDFELLFAPLDNVERRPDIWFAARTPYNNANRAMFSVRPIGRLRPGASLDQARLALAASASRIRQEFAAYAASGFHARLEPMHQSLVRSVRPTLLALMGSVALLLLIACANVLNLLLVRASLRSREMAVRSALGSGTWPLIRLSLAEMLIIAALGALAGLTLAHLGLAPLMALAPPDLPRLDAVAFAPVVYGVTALIAFLAAAVLALASQWGTLRTDLAQALRGSGRTAGLASGGGRLRDAVVIVEVALCFALLIASGLMYRSFGELLRIDPGFDARGVLTFEILGVPGDTPAKRSAQVRAIDQALRATPGVVAVTASQRLPLAGGYTTIRWGTSESAADPSKFQAVDWQSVRPGFFETLRTPLLEGRLFTEADNDPARAVVVVDRYLAAKAAPNGTAVGKRILLRVRTPEPEWVEIIGVVEHQRIASLAEPGREQVYFTDGFLGFGRAQRWSVRTQGRPLAVTAGVRAQLAMVDAKLGVAQVQPLEDLVERAQSGTLFSLTLLGVFTMAAVVLVAVGLYGVLSTVVRQRTAEIGLRMALGAEPTQILRMVIGYALRLTAVGTLLGVVAAVGFARAMTTMLVGIQPTDPVTYAATAALLVTITAAASWLPAWRASKMHPVRALAQE